MGDPLRLYGLNALVTNAASGIGEAISRTLIKHGARVLAVDTANSGVEQHFQSVKGIEGYSASLTDASRMPALVEEAVSRLGGIDILVNEFPLNGEAPLADGDAQLAFRFELQAPHTRSQCGHQARGAVLDHAAQRRRRAASVVGVSRGARRRGRVG